MRKIPHYQTVSISKDKAEWAKIFEGIDNTNNPIVIEFDDPEYWDSDRKKSLRNWLRVRFSNLNWPYPIYILADFDLSAGNWISSVEDLPKFYFLQDKMISKNHVTLSNLNYSLERFFKYIDWGRLENFLMTFPHNHKAKKVNHEACRKIDELDIYLS